MTKVVEFDANYKDKTYHLKNDSKGFFIKPHGRKYWTRITERQFKNASKFIVK